MARSDFLPFSPPSIDHEEIEEITAALKSGWLSTGPRTQQFQTEFAATYGASAALALNSCTSALHTALVALGVGPGDEVITSTMTFAATANVIEHTGAKPVLVDVEPDTLNIDPRAIKAAINERTKGIIPVHFAGHPAEMDEIEALAKAHGLFIIEDAAHSLPAAYKERKIGSGKNPTAFSFYATKNLTTGEGGMLTGDPDFIAKSKIISLHGISRDAWQRYSEAGSWFYEIVLPGFKYNMSDLQAALGLKQLKKMPGFHERRKQIVATYNQAFQKNPCLEIPTSRSHVDHAWHLYVLRLKPNTLKINRDVFIEELKALKIGTSVHFIPVHLHPYYKNKYRYSAEQMPVAYSNFQRMLSIPLNTHMSDRDVKDVIESVETIVARHKK